jgi:hypothetical protein
VVVGWKEEAIWDIIMSTTSSFISNPTNNIMYISFSLVLISHLQSFQHISWQWQFSILVSLCRFITCLINWELERKTIIPIMFQFTRRPATVLCYTHLRMYQGAANPLHIIMWLSCKCLLKVLVWASFKNRINHNRVLNIMCSIIWRKPMLENNGDDDDAEDSMMTVAVLM